MSYIFLTGAPGSKWSSVAGDIRPSPELDSTDSSPSREYKSSNAEGPAHHVGAYWDPGMEFSTHPDEWDKPFSGSGIRVIKSHTFAYKLYELKKYNCPIVMVYRKDVDCYSHWMKAGGFDITYPDYKPYYKDYGNMYVEIAQQNYEILNFVYHHSLKRAEDLGTLCRLLGITRNNENVIYEHGDVEVYVYGSRYS